MSCPCNACRRKRSRELYREQQDAQRVAQAKATRLRLIERRVVERKDAVWLAGRTV